MKLPDDLPREALDAALDHGQSLWRFYERGGGSMRDFAGDLGCSVAAAMRTVHWFPKGHVVSTAYTGPERRRSRV